MDSDSVDIRSIVEGLRERPLMFIPELRYGMFVAFLCGVNEAMGRSFLQGFSSWIGRRVSGSNETSLVWSATIAGQYSPGVMEGKSSIANLSAEADRRATADLFKLLIEFLDQRN